MAHYRKRFRRGRTLGLTGLLLAALLWAPLRAQDNPDAKKPDPPKQEEPKKDAPKQEAPKQEPPPDPKAVEYAQALKAGQDLLNEGQCAPAREQFAKCAALQPKKAEPPLLIGRAWEKENKFSEAVKSYQKAYDLEPAAAQLAPLTALAKRFEGERKWDAALEIHQFFYQKNNADQALVANLVRVWTAKGQELLGQNKFADARKEFEQLLILQPKEAEPHRLLGDAFEREKNLPEALKRYQQAYALKKEAPFLAPLKKLAKQYEDGRKWTEALAVQQYLYEQNAQAAADLNELVRVRVAAGQDALGQSKFPEARAYFEQAAQLQPREAEHLRAVGETYEREKNIPEALKGYQQAYALKKGEPYLGLLRKIAKQYEGERKWTEALAVCQFLHEQNQQDAAFLAERVRVGKAAGQDLLEQSKFPEARVHFEQAAKLQPQEAEFPRLIGDALEREKKLPEAIERYKQAFLLKKDDTNRAPLKKLAKQFEDTRKWSDAIAVHQYLYEQHKTDAAYLTELARVHEAAGRNLLEAKNTVADARTHFEQAAQLKPQEAELQRLLGEAYAKENKPDEAVAQYQKAYALKKEEQYYTPLRDQAQLWEKGKLWPKAIAIHQFLHAQNPPTESFRDNLARAQTAYGSELLASQKPAEARAEYAKALALKPQEAELHRLTGDAFAAEKNSAEAVAAYKRAYELKPESAYYQPLFATAQQFEQAKQWDAAIDVFKFFHDKNTGDAERLKNLTQAHVGKGADLAAQKKWPEARAAYEQAAKLQPREAEHHRRMGETLVSEGQPAQAIPHYKQAYELNQAEAYWKAIDGLATALEQAKQWDAAIDVRLHLYGKNTGDGARRLALARVYEGKGRELLAGKKFAEARKEFESARGLLPQEPEHSRLTGETYEKEANWTEAVKFYKAAYKLKREASYLAPLKAAAAQYAAAENWDAAIDVHTYVWTTNDQQATDAKDVVAAREAKGRALLAAKQYPAARGEFEQALRLDSKNPELHRLCGETFEQERADYLPPAVERYKQAYQLQTDATYLAPLTAVAQHYAKANQWDQSIAIQQFVYDANKRAAAFLPPLTGAWEGKGKYLLSQKDYGSARAEFDKSLPHRPNDPELHRLIGEAREGEKQYDSASTSYRKAYSLSPTEPYLNALLTLAKKLEAENQETQWNLAIQIHQFLYDSNKQKGKFGVALAAAWEGKGRYQLGRNYFSQGRAEFEKALQLRPKDAELLLLIGQTHQGEQQYDKAIESYCYAYARQPDDVRLKSLVDLAKALEPSRKWDSAIAIYQFLYTYHRKTKPDDAKVETYGAELARTLEAKGSNLLANGQYAPARAEFAKAVKLDPKRAELHRLTGKAFERERNLPQASASYQAAYVLSQEQPYHDAVKRLAKHCEDSREWDTSIELFEFLYTQDKAQAERLTELTRVLKGKGSHLLRANDAATARLTLLKALKLDPQDPAVHKLLGDAYLERSKTNATALKYYQQAYDLKADEATLYALQTMARRYRSERQDAAGIEIHRYLYEKDKKNESFVTNLTQAYEYQARQDAEKKAYANARAAYEKSLAVKPDRPDIVHYIADAYEKEKIYEDAFTWHKKAYELKPDDDYYYHIYLLGRALEERKVYTLAITVYRYLFEKSHKKADGQRYLTRAYEVYGQSLSKKKQYPEARAQYEQSLKLKPKEPELHLWIGGTFEDEKKPNDAVEWYKKAYQLNRSGTYLQPLNKWAKNFSDDKRWDDSIKIHRFIYDERQKHPSYAFNLITVLGESGKRDYQQAAEVALDSYRKYDWEGMEERYRDSSRKRLIRELAKAYEKLDVLKTKVNELKKEWEKDKGKYPDRQLLMELTMHAGYSASQRREYSDSIDFYRVAIELLPDDPKPYYDLARQLRYSQQMATALQVYRQGLEKFPDSDLLVGGEAELLWEMGDYEPAREAYFNLFKKSTDSWLEAESKLALAEKDGDKNRIRSAQEVRSSAVRTMAQHGEKVLNCDQHMGNLVSAQTMLDTLRDMLMDQPNLASYEREILKRLNENRYGIYAATGKIDDLVQEKLDVCLVEPKNHQPYLDLADLYLEIGERGLAVGYYLLASQHNEKGEELLLDKADKLAGARRKDDAVAFYETFIQGFPRHAKITQALEKYSKQWPRDRERWHRFQPATIRAFQLIEQTAGGLETNPVDALGRALEPKVVEKAAWQRLDAHFAYQLADREVWEDAIAQYRELLKRYPDHIYRRTVLEKIRDIYSERLGDFARARDASLEFYHEYKDRDSLLEYSKHCTLLGDRASSPVLAGYLKDHPEDLWVKLNYAELQLQQGDLATAVRLMKEIYYTQPSKEAHKYHDQCRRQIDKLYRNLIRDSSKPAAVDLPTNWSVQLEQVYENCAINMDESEPALHYTKQTLKLPKSLQRPYELTLESDGRACMPTPFALLEHPAPDRQVARWQVTDEELNAFPQIVCQTQYQSMTPPDFIVRRGCYMEGENSQIHEIYLKSKMPKSQSFTVRINLNDIRQSSIKQVLPEKGHKLSGNQITLSSDGGFDFDRGTTLTIRSSTHRVWFRGALPKFDGHLPQIDIDINRPSRDLVAKPGKDGRLAFDVKPFQVAVDGVKQELPNGSPVLKMHVSESIRYTLASLSASQ